MVRSLHCRAGVDVAHVLWIGCGDLGVLQVELVPVGVGLLRSGNRAPDEEDVSGGSTWGCEDADRLERVRPVLVVVRVGPVRVAVHARSQGIAAELQLHLGGVMGGLNLAHPRQPIADGRSADGVIGEGGLSARPDEPGVIPLGLPRERITELRDVRWIASFITRDGKDGKRGNSQDTGRQPPSRRVPRHLRSQNPRILLLDRWLVNGMESGSFIGHLATGNQMR